MINSFSKIQDQLEFKQSNLLQASGYKSCGRGGTGMQKQRFRIRIRDLQLVSQQLNQRNIRIRAIPLLFKNTLCFHILNFRSPSIIILGGINSSLRQDLSQAVSSFGKNSIPKGLKILRLIAAFTILHAHVGSSISHIKNPCKYHLYFSYHPTIPPRILTELRYCHPIDRDQDGQKLHEPHGGWGFFGSIG